MLAVKALQIRRKELARHRVAGADGQRTQQKLLGLRELVLTRGQQAQRVADILVEHPALSRQRHTPGGPGEQPRLQSRFQLLDGLAHRRLRNVQVFRRRRDIARFRHFLEYPV